MRALVPVAAVVLAVAACGGAADSSGGVASLDDPTDTSTATVEDEADAEQALLDVAACMRDAGVDIEDPTVDADGNLEFGAIRGRVAESDLDVDREAIRAAFDECGELLESVTLGFRRGDDAAFQDTLLEYAQCMRDNGVDMDDPDFSSAGPGEGGETGDDPGARRGPFGNIDPEDPDFLAAQEVCRDILGGFERIPGPGGGPGAGGGEN
jgi:hypothetical protein